jgi:hypothetical protein
MLIADYIAISGLVVSVERLSALFPPILLATVRRRKVA